MVSNSYFALLTNLQLSQAADPFVSCVSFVRKTAQDSNKAVVKQGQKNQSLLHKENSKVEATSIYKTHYCILVCHERALNIESFRID